jgi:photosystem II stability/assembly factor-like uncharacterized protein
MTTSWTASALEVLGEIMKDLSIFVVSSLFLCIAPLSQSLAQVWGLFGLQAEEVNSIAIDPKDSRVVFVGSMSDFSAGTTGSVFKTTTGGAHWDTLLHGLSVNKVVLHPTSSDTLFVLSGTANFSPPGILKSCDGGRTWAWSDSGMFLSSECSPFSMAINPANPSIMYAGTGGFGGGSFYKSTDAGRFWFWTPDSMSGSITAVVLDPAHPETLYVATTGVGPVWESLDGRMHWNKVFQLSSGAVDLAVDPVSTNNLYALITYYDGGPFARSTDRGLTWVERRIAGSTQHGAHSLVLDPRRRNELYAIASTASDSWVFKSTDLGDTWEQFDQGIEGYAPNVLCIDSAGDHIYVGTKIPTAGKLGGIWIRSLATSVTEESVPGLFQISEAYPNPFNSMSTVRYYVPTRERVVVTAWDILGRQVKKIVDETQEPGQHVARIDGSNLASGVYFYRIVAGSFTETTRLLLIR